MGYLLHLDDLFVWLVFCVLFIDFDCLCVCLVWFANCWLLVFLV